MDAAEPHLDLEALPFFAGLPKSARDRLLGVSGILRAGAGTVVFEQGETPRFQYLVVDGTAQLFGRTAEGREVLIDVVEPSELLLPAALASGGPYLMQARTPEPSRLVLIPAAAFREAMVQEPALSQAVVASLARQFRRMARQIKNLKLRSASERVGCYILAQARRQGSPSRVVLPLEKKLIASELGLTRESFSRALSGLRRHGIAMRGDTIDILDAARLAAACRPDPLIDFEDPPLGQDPHQGSETPR
jgi:CRP/FNR family transcriptional regulator, transcriptional activator FtrB